jgi:tRNA(Arg) A34 adenosine deaminase TadA
MPVKLDDDGRRYLRMAVELSRCYRDDPRKWPFGAVLAGQGMVHGRGSNQVAGLRDPSAHAEIMALRAAGLALGRHTFEDCVLYSSSEPCPMCLAACYWASVPRVVFAATSRDLAGYDFQDLAFHAELRLPAGRRSMREDADGDELRKEALVAVRDWAQRGGPAVEQPSSA